MNDENEHIDKLMHELRRGTITIGALSQLYEPQYGYSLVTRLKEKGIQVEPGTLYPLLRRLEKQGLLESKWDTNETRPRKYYLLSDTGKDALDLLRVEWQSIVTSMQNVLKESGDENGDD
ncbi:DNA-binding transcriptional regulator, PadR family [Lentibacillus halodurans]|uniref:DNA-binding transcriptional regulator, PadR family n=1 Tax=Lentibacillus halodurans TaxID=237679 RepID=A0A1I0Y733_9BACI|nr:helix-turn-helix transcriptional regulator [Lentibacillus halodurans]SFB08657.1 DNA-binding transcriptional regulator, PadR family [Lentibacillus halodurans]